MGARRETLSTFASANGFSHHDITAYRPFGADGAPPSFPDFPAQNAKLQQLYRYVDPNGPIAGAVIQTLEVARMYRDRGPGQGNEEIVAGAMIDADRLLDAALKEHAGEKRWLLIVTLIVAVLGIAAVLYARRKRSPRRNLPKRRKRRKSRTRRRAPKKLTAKEIYASDEDEGDDDDDGDEDSDE